MSLFWELHQQRKIRDAASKATSANLNAKRAKFELVKLDRRCDKALLVCEALWTLLRDKLGVSEDELRERVKDLDASDGRLDGEVRKPPIDCPACQRPSPSRLDHCMYCGVELEPELFGT